MVSSEEIKKESWQLGYDCRFCGTSFTPKKRWVQKYCSESCRVMACRERKNSYLGLGDVVVSKGKNRTTNKEILNQLDSLRTEVKKDLKSINTKANWMLIIEVVSLLKQFLDTWNLKAANERNEEQLAIFKKAIENQLGGNNTETKEMISALAKQMYPQYSSDISKIV